ncbi:N2227-like protein-domain-containing protein [Rhodofomes roseus]|uniref:N2227-like protein-domain-containing protein n=1 Tax=Rhodofomes roseus TaxID=34475 RepID=A0ABQ8K9W3_9APHY|nr:N2227-like protein-domain-containing protein [Rhodofomes roseus]KAH9834161.1 N2227-like protein-domain-containing protein [Rhodofomes roseus]
MLDHVVQTLSSDTLLACLIPALLFIFSLYFSGLPSLSGLRQNVAEIIAGRRRTTFGHFSVERAALSYQQYAKLSRGELATMQASYGKLGRAHKRVGYDMDYPAKLNRLQEAIALNAKVTEGIVQLGKEEFPDRLSRGDWQSAGVHGDVHRVRESLKHFVRDWSEEGRAERANIFGPILDVLQDVKPAARQEMRVLIPGSGLGRLAWEVSQMGYVVTANELSFFMNLAFRFLLSESTTEHVNQHTLQPYASWFSHQRTVDALFRSVQFPDTVPRRSTNLELAECDFLGLERPPALRTGGPAGYDFIVTLFFIDTSLNIVETLEHIHGLLKPGGTWINLGPLLWTGGGQAALELSLEEVLRLAGMIGFEIASDTDGPRRRRTIECEYTADREAMMRWLYQAGFWVATRMR